MIMKLHQRVVLVVDDESLIRMGAAAELEDEGFRVFEAQDADDAMMLLRSEPSIGLLFTDIDMPGSMNGLMLATAVRDRWPPVRIIVTSGQFTISEADLPRGSRFFPKPYRTSEIAACFREMAA